MDPATQGAERDVIAVPSWLRRLATVGWRVLVSLALVLLVIRIAVALSSVTASILVALVVSATVLPYARTLRARGWGDAKVAGVITLGVIGTLVVAGIILAFAIIPSLVALAQATTAGLAAFGQWLESAGVSADAIDVIRTAIDDFETWLRGVVLGMLGGVAGLVTIMTLGGFLTFYFLKDGEGAWRQWLETVTPWRRPPLLAAAERAMAEAGGWVRGTAVIAALDAIVMWLTLTILDAPLAGPVAAIVFIGSFIPYVGPFVTTILAALVAAATGGVLAGAIVIAVTIILRLLEHRFLAPFVYGRTANIHPAIVLVALPVGLALAGPVGMVVAVPALAVGVALSGAVVDILGSQRRREPLADGVPVWLDRVAQWSWRLLVGAGLIAVALVVAVNLPVVIAPFVIAVTLAATFLPAVRALQGRGFSRMSASAVVSVVLWTVVVVVTLASVASLAGPTTQALQSALQGAGMIDDTLPSGAAGAIEVVAGALASGVLQAAASVFATLVGIVLVLVLAALLAFFMLVDGSNAWRLIVDRIGGWRGREIGEAGDTAVEMLGGYMFATGALALFNGVTGWVVMMLLGLPFALPVAILSFFGGFIPYIGQAITSLLAFLIAIAFGSVTDIAIMAVWTAVFNVVQGSVIAPIVYGRAVSLHPALVLIAIPAGGSIAGILGMFLAVPILGIVGKVGPKLLAALGDEPASDDPEAPATTGEVAMAEPEVTPAGA